MLENKQRKKDRNINKKYETKKKKTKYKFEDRQ